MAEKTQFLAQKCNLKAFFLNFGAPGGGEGKMELYSLFSSGKVELSSCGKVEL